MQTEFGDADHRIRSLGISLWLQGCGVPKISVPSQPTTQSPTPYPILTFIPRVHLSAPHTPSQRGGGCRKCTKRPIQGETNTAQTNRCEPFALFFHCHFKLRVLWLRHWSHAPRDHCRDGGQFPTVRVDTIFSIHPVLLRGCCFGGTR